MDPQHRLLLETSYEAMEDAGVKMEDASGSATAVYVGLSTHDYGDIQNVPSERTNIGQHTNTGGSFCIAVNRISYIFNLLGPSMAIDTACSSSLVAIHQACESIRSGDVDLAIAGGVSLMLTPLTHIQTSQFRMLQCFRIPRYSNGRTRSRLKTDQNRILSHKPVHRLSEFP